jgi:hypothetical protein
MSAPILELRLHFWSGLRIYDGDGTLVGKYRTENVGTPEDRRYRGVIVTPHDEIDWFMESVGKADDSFRPVPVAEVPHGLAGLRRIVASTGGLHPDVAHANDHLPA